MLTGGLLLAPCCLSVSKVPEEFNCGPGDISEVLCDEEWRVGGGFGLCLVGFVCVDWAGGCFPSPLLPLAFSYCCSYEGNGNTQQLKLTVTNYHIWETTIWWLLVLLFGCVCVCGVFSCVFYLRL